MVLGSFWGAPKNKSSNYKDHHFWESPRSRVPQNPEPLPLPPDPPHPAEGSRRSAIDTQRPSLGALPVIRRAFRPRSRRPPPSSLGLPPSCYNANATSTQRPPLESASRHPPRPSIRLNPMPFPSPGPSPFYLQSHLRIYILNVHHPGGRFPSSIKKCLPKSIEN